MNREQLEHAIRAACDVANEDIVIVFGSQAILGSHPDASGRRPRRRRGKRTVVRW